MSTDNLAKVHTDIPCFRFIQKLVDARQMNERYGYPEGDVKLCYPTVLDIGRHLPYAMARYYMYSSPHDHGPGCGIGMWTADKVEGPWKFRGRVIGNSQAVPSVVYNKERKKVVVYSHGPNGENHIFDSADGVNFEYRHRMNLQPPAQGYGQVFRYVFPDRGPQYCALVWLGICPPGCSYSRHWPYTGLYVSDDGYNDWQCIDRDLYPPANKFTGNSNVPVIANNPHFAVFGSSQYVLFGSSETDIWAYKVDEMLRPVTYAGLVLQASQLPESGGYTVAVSPWVLQNENREFYMLFGAKKHSGEGGDILLARGEPAGESSEQ